MLTELLENQKCFKLVCGAGNEDTSEVERLVYIYAKAGCRFFDLSANVEVLNAAKRGYSKANVSEKPHFCISFGIKGDPHINKAEILSEFCDNCGACEQVCPQNAVKDFVVAQKRCIGCGKCLEVCKSNAIQMHSTEVLPSDFLKKIDLSEISCVELHANSLDESDFLAKWKDISDNFDGLLSICIDRLYLGNCQVLKRINSMLNGRKPYTAIIQADGVPMSGAEDDYKTTLQAVAMAEIIQNANLPVYLLLSGGTNSKTAQLAEQCGIDFHGISIGSYARKIVREYTCAEDFWQNKNAIDTAVSKAKSLTAF